MTAITFSRTPVTLAITIISLSFSVVPVRTVSIPRDNASSNQLKPPSNRSEPETPSVVFVENAGQFDSRIRFQAQARNGNFRLVDQAIWMTLFDRTASVPTNSRQTTRISKATVLTNEQFHQATRDKKNLILQRHDDERALVQSKGLSGVNVKLNFPGGSLSPWVGSSQLETKFAYFLGNNKKTWRSNVPVWATASYQNLYPGIDLITESYEGSLALRFHKSQQTPVSVVQLRVEGPTAARIVPSKIIKGSELQLTTTSGILSLPIAGVTATGANIKKVAKSTWDVSLAVLSPASSDAHHVRTKVSRASSLTRNAIITGQTVGSLQVLYSTYLGSIVDDNANGVVMDEAGNAFVTGWTFSMSFPFPGSPGPFIGAGGEADAFVVKIDPRGRRLLFATFLGGPVSDSGNGVAVDVEGSAIVTGTTYSGNDFPTLGPTWGTGGGADLFVTKLDPSGMSLVYSVRAGGSQQDAGQRIAVDPNNRVAVVGSSSSDDFPTTPGVVATVINRGLASGSDFGTDAVVLKLGEFGTTLLYSTFLGGAAGDRGNDIVLDDEGNAFVTGETYSYDDPVTPAKEGFPVTDLAFQREGPVGGVLYSPARAVVPNSDAFVAKLTPDGRALLYCSYLGGPGPDRGTGVAITSSGQAVVTGAATEGFPTHDAYSSFSGGVLSPFGDGEVPVDAFVTVFNESGGDLEYSTFLGGAENDTGSSIDVDTSGNVYVTGWTYSTDASSRPFPRTRDPFLTSLRRTFGNGDIFAAKLNPSLSGPPSLLYSTIFGGRGMDLPWDISVNSGGIICIAGYSESRDYPTQPRDVLRRTFIGGRIDGVVTKLDLRR